MTTVLHVGYPKTATKTLQCYFFPTLPDCAVYSPAQPNFTDFLPAWRSLSNADEGEVEFEALREFVEQQRGDQQTLLVSLEELTPLDHDGRTPRRIKLLLGDARVFVCVREQRSMLYALHGEYVRGGGTLSLGAYTGANGGDWLSYGVLIERYQRLFGAEQVLVLPHELLVEDPSSFLARLREFIVPDAVRPYVEPELPVFHRGMARPTRWTHLLANRLFGVELFNPLPRLEREGGAQAIGRTIERLGEMLLADLGLTPGRRARAILERVSQRYAESNALLARLTGLPLRELGYIVAASGSAPGEAPYMRSPYEPS